MTSVIPRIQIFGMSELNAILKQHSEPQCRQSLADGLFRLLLLQADYIHNQPTRVGSITPVVPMSTRDTPEFFWTIQDDPDPQTGLRGTNVLHGGLVMHNDGYWGIHT